MKGEQRTPGLTVHCEEIVELLPTTSRAHSTRT